MKVIAVTQARTGSARFPGKILKKINDITLLDIHLRRILGSKAISELVVATTISEEDVQIVSLAKSLGLFSYQGSVDDVLDRFYRSLQGKSADYVVRLTSDCPLIDPELIDKIIQHTIVSDLDYCSNTLDPKYPDGQDVEVFRFSALERAWQEAKLSSEREHVTPYIWKNSTFKGGVIFKSSNFDEGYSYGHQRMTVDEPKDLELISGVIAEKGVKCTWLEYAQYLDKNLKLKEVNAAIGRNEGYDKSINKESK